MIKTRTESDAEVAEGAAGDRHVDGELSITESREKSAESGNSIRYNNGRTSVKPTSTACGDEDTSSNHPTYTEPNKVEPPQAFDHVGPRTSSDPAHFFKRG